MEREYYVEGLGQEVADVHWVIGVAAQALGIPHTLCREGTGAEHYISVEVQFWSLQDAVRWMTSLKLPTDEYLFGRLPTVTLWGWDGDDWCDLTSPDVPAKWAEDRAYVEAALKAYTPPLPSFLQPKAPKA